MNLFCDQPHHWIYLFPSPIYVKSMFPFQMNWNSIWTLKRHHYCMKKNKRKNAIEENIKDKPVAGALLAHMRGHHPPSIANFIVFLFDLFYVSNYLFVTLRFFILRSSFIQEKTSADFVIQIQAFPD